MKTLDVVLIPTNLNKFLFKDEFYNYSLRGKELVLSPLGKRKERRYFLTDDEISQLMSYYVAPLEKLHNEYPYVVGIMDEILDIEDDMMAFVDSLIR